MSTAKVRLKTNQRLRETIQASVPAVKEVHIGRHGDSTTVTVEPSSQQAAAQSIIDSFDWSEAAFNAWYISKQREWASGFLDSPLPEYKLLRALMLVVLDEINTIRAALVPALPARTGAQLRTAIRNKLNAGNAD